MAFATETLATGLLIPEGPVALRDGSVIIVEVGSGRISRIGPDGQLHMIARIEGGPNGAAIGPDGALYLCNNGGGFDCQLIDGLLRIRFAPDQYVGGSIQRLDIETGTVTSLYTTCDGKPLLAPNDLVFDHAGGMWCTDHGTSAADHKVYGGLYYAHIDGGMIRCARGNLLSPNGIGLSPDGRWLYWADTITARIWRAEICATGELADYGHAPGELVATVPGHVMLDSLAIEADGRICVGSIMQGGIMVIDPGNGSIIHVLIDDHMVTNICFGGEDQRDVWITAAGTGRLLKGRWPRPGLALAF